MRDGLTLSLTYIRVAHLIFAFFFVRQRVVLTDEMKEIRKKIVISRGNMLLGENVVEGVKFNIFFNLNVFNVLLASF